MIKKPETVVNSVKFIVGEGITAVTGDFGNWIFCREFHPSANETVGVSREYFDEKLHIFSQQEAKIFDSEETLKEIKEFKKNYTDYHGERITDEVTEWLKDLMQNIDNEEDYKYYAYRKTPLNVDYSEVPFGKKRHFWLDVVYDAFQEICKALKKESDEK
ncbi:hypothetical protein J2810_004624 [Chryseobacterium rhizosphaerae]|uniref:hypothetical protein n=1 Tax=Chryseobacterium rhizosphaerae TaxID=395937 RepID=UPI00285C7FEA|nr:hypothetical protein [Chryseobacterium rhizosphaerae]MDR6548534.1 hypothetical protein [Chryseobacterium rhizosphaerae]